MSSVGTEGTTPSWNGPNTGSLAPGERWRVKKKTMRQLSFSFIVQFPGKQYFGCQKNLQIKTLGTDWRQRNRSNT